MTIILHPSFIVPLIAVTILGAVVLFAYLSDKVSSSGLSEEARIVLAISIAIIVVVLGPYMVYNVLSSSIELLAQGELK